MQILRLRLNVTDRDVATTFYTGALGFERVEDRRDATVLRLGRQEIELVRSQGAAYPSPRAANDPWFQHFAIAVRDMTAAYAQLLRFGQGAVSRGGPQLLPPSTGAVTAYKFRDPDGHPLELSYVPGSPWLTQARPGDGPFLGIDHTAIAVSDLQRSLAFYEALGFQRGPSFLNTGREQDRLDGLDDVRLDIVVMTTPEPGPHIELLHYRTPQPAPVGAERKQSDIAATRTVISGEPARHLSDPDGHRVEVRASPTSC